MYNAKWLSRFLLSSLVLFLIVSSGMNVGTVKAATITVNMDGNGTGKTFDGIGTVLTGGTQKLLSEYPATQRSEILDFLFKPNFGASLQIVKMEMGGDINSSSGTEPSVKRTSSETAVPRGSALWMAKEAKNRNANIKFGALRWGIPNWANSSDAYRTSYYMGYMDAANANGTPIDYLGVAKNESGSSSISKTWLIDSLLPALDTQYPNTKIVAADEYQSWGIADRMLSDSALNDAIDIVGSHYIATSTSNAKSLGKPLWDSEAVPPGGFTNTLTIMHEFISKYVDGHMTAKLLQPAVDALYESAVYNKKGFIKANTPWSGYYKIDAGLWGIAHVTQFAQPGWKILDSGTGKSSDLNYMTFKSPTTTDYSIFVVNKGISTQTMTFNMYNLSAGVVHSWKTDEQDWFIKQPDITPASGSFTVTIPANSMITYTTTTGQKKGTSSYQNPVNSQFALPYTDSFESYAVGNPPQYTSDQGGAFEVAARSDSGKALRQLIPSAPGIWNSNPEPITFLGSTKWRNYEVSIDALNEGPTGYVSLHGRLLSIGQNSGTDPVHSYQFKIYPNGEWKLFRFKTQLAAGTATIHASWNNLKLRFINNTIQCYINGVQVGSTVTDDNHFSGMIGIGSGWNLAQFDNLSIQPITGYSPSVDRVDDQALTLTGAWTKAGSFTDYERSTFYTSVANRAAEYTFKGHTIGIIGRKGVANGEAEVFIDNVSQGMIDTYNSGTLYKTALFQQTGLTDEVHTIKLVVKGTHSASSTGNLIELDSVEYQSSATASTSINDNTTGTANNQFNYSGSWSYGSQSGAYSLDNHWSSNSTHYVTINFVGSEIDIYGAINSNEGIAAVSIDGGAETMVDLYAAARQDNVPYFKSSILPYGSHSLRIRVTGKRNPSSTANIITVDRAVIRN
jgi:galactosylceramidase